MGLIVTITPQWIETFLSDLSQELSSWSAELIYRPNDSDYFTVLGKVVGVATSNDTINDGRERTAKLSY